MPVLWRHLFGYSTQWRRRRRRTFVDIRRQAKRDRDARPVTYSQPSASTMGRQEAPAAAQSLSQLPFVRY